MDLITGKLIQRTIQLPLNSNYFNFYRVDNSDQTNTIRWQLVFKDDFIANSIKVGSNGKCNIIDYYKGGGADKECIFMHPSAFPNRLQIKQLRTDTRFTTSEELELFLLENQAYIVLELATESVKTVDLTVQNQDGGTIPHIQTQQGITHVSTSSDGLTPVVEMSCSYDTIIKPNTTYTIKLDRPIVSDTMYLQVDLGGTMMMLDADVNAFTIKTPSTLSHSQLRLSGVGNTVKEIIVLEGSRVNDKIEYFEGMKNVENPILVVSNCPHIFGKGGRL